MATGLGAFDEALGGGLDAGAFTEVVSSASGGGGQLLTAALIDATRRARQRLALLDAADAFDVDAFTNAQLAHLVWLRGGGALKPFWLAADILLRDANFAVVVMDLRLLPERELRRVPATTWYRLQRAVEQSEAAVLVHTDFALVPCAARRLVLSTPLSVSAFKQERVRLQDSLAPRLELQRNHGRIAG